MRKNSCSSSQQPPAATAKKPCGRPPGSKNKPKPSSSQVTGQSSEPSDKIIKINVAPGMDIMESIIDVAHQGQANITILSVSGTIANATLRTSHNSEAFMFYGPFTLLSLSGSYIYNNPPSFWINLCTSQGQVLGGFAAGTVVASDNVSLIVSTITNPEIFNNNIPQSIHGHNVENDDTNQN